ncbi:uncharacterized protein BCR38DRAFT_484048 [Pseudomassariella vexata]|uniref:Uncharacterized protein n=1 Tax=Pseudomassariella vexata TaxID=1141098 RepID=A0A1Y2E6B9_9PEZI|nr:uncharacterized protein BCR38DRAFT_484048 [Pseudomassariella vexata]ORY66415.1 hypothetical protein BCR38DRAFT_484048 [Pseudomassariella vexata]
MAERFEGYMGRGDLDFTEEFRSKPQCREALEDVGLNIIDFLDAVEHGNSVPPLFVGGRVITVYADNWQSLPEEGRQERKSVA